MNHDVFISYSSKNKTTALAICHVLEEHRIRCWIAPRDVPPGENYGDVIDEAIVSCPLFILVFSGPATLSQWVNGELNVAFTERKIIIPYRIDETPLKGAMRLILNQTHWIEAYPDAATRFGELVEAAERVLGRSVTSDKAPYQNRSLLAFEPVVPKNPTPVPPRTYKVGDYYNENGKEGIVFKVDTMGCHGKIMAICDLPKELSWCAEKEYYDETKVPEIGATDEADGLRNMNMARTSPGWPKMYPAFATCAALGEDWYLPAQAELKELYKNKDYLSSQAQKFGGLDFEDENYWSSSEDGSTGAWLVNFGNGNLNNNYKLFQYRVRAIATF